MKLAVDLFVFFELSSLVFFRDAFFFFNFLNGSIVDLQCYVSFWCTTK